MKLLSWNIAIRQTNNDEVIGLLRQENADIICLQEVGKAEESGVKKEYDSFHAIMETKLYPYRFMGESHEFKAFNTRNIEFGGYMREGVLILSKYPIIKADSSFYHRQFERREDFSTRRQTDHGRMIIRTVIDINGQQIQVCGIHGIWTKDKNGDERTIQQAKYIVDKAQERDYPTIITGDFNLLPNTESIQILNQSFENLISTYNISSTRPIFDDGLDKGDEVVDYAFTKNIKTKNCYTINNNISDHLPLITEF